MSARRHSKPVLEALEAKIALSHVHAAVAHPAAVVAHPAAVVSAVPTGTIKVTDTISTDATTGLTVFTVSGRGNLRHLGLTRVYGEGAQVTNADGSITQVAGVNIVSRYGTTISRITSYPGSVTSLPIVAPYTIVSGPGAGLSGIVTVYSTTRAVYLKLS